jgi:hypothetical protein
LMASTNISNLELSIFMGKGAAMQGLFQLQIINGQPGGQMPGSITRCLCIPVHAMGKPFTPPLTQERSEFPHKAY